MSDINQKLAWVSKNLFKVEDLISQKNLKTQVKRVEVAKVLGKAVENINISLGVLPNTLKYDNQDLVAKLRKINVTSNSIIQALNDKVCGAITARKLIKDVNRDLRRLNVAIRNSLAERITLARSREGSVPENIKLQVEKTILASEKAKVTLNSLSELDRYMTFMEDMKKQLNILDSAIEKNAGPSAPDVAIIDPKKAEEYSKSLDRPVENLHFRENVYDQKLNENTMSTQRALADVVNQIPKSVKIDASGFAIIRAPVLAITQYYIADTVLRKSGLKYLRMPGSFSAGFTPGMSTKSGGGESSYTIFEKQLLLVLPANLLREPEKLRELRRDAMRGLENRLGKLSIVRFGIGSSRVLDKELVDESGKKGDPSGFDQALDKREYFSNRNYPGVIFMWILPTERFATLGSIRFLNINIASAPNLKNTIEPSVTPQKGKDTDIEKRSKEEQIAYEDRLKNLQAAKVTKDKITAPLRSQLDTLEAKIKATRLDAKQATNSLNQAKTALIENTRQISRLVPGSNDHKTQLAARRTTDIAVAHFQGELDAISKDILPSLYKQRIALKAEIDAAVADFVAKRRKKK